MKTEAFNFYVASTNDSITKQLDLMERRLREMADSVARAKAHAQPIEGSPIDAKQQLTQNLDSLRYATHDVYTNLLGNLRLDLATGLMVEASKLLVVPVED